MIHLFSACLLYIPNTMLDSSDIEMMNNRELVRLGMWHWYKKNTQFLINYMYGKRGREEWFKLYNNIR